MIDFWIGASVLLLVALAFLLMPLLRGRRAQAEEDRTALNVALYEERLGELTAQHAAGVLSQEQLEAGRADAARELLDDTEQAGARPNSRLGRSVPLVIALLVPVAGLGLYMHWGASDKLELARQFTEQPKSASEMIQRLEQAVQAQPDSPDAWYFLARTYMSQERPAQAAAAFERVVALSGREPDLLGQWAQALYFAGDRQWNERLQKLVDEALLADPNEITSLGLLGIAAYESQRYQEAADHWERLVNALPEDDPSREAIRGGIAQARAQAGQDGEAAGEPAEQPSASSAAPAAAEGEARVQVAVTLSDEAKASVQPGDVVFVFARALSGPAVPLAAKRLTIEQLPLEVSLSDADAMAPQFLLSSAEQVRLYARVSRSGDASKGEWIGQSKPLSVRGEQSVATLVIDQPETR